MLIENKFMRVVIISDIHNNNVNLRKVLDFCEREKIETIICCGDLASLETLDFLNDNFTGEIHYTFGNMDNDQMSRHLLSTRQNNPGISNVICYKNTFIYTKFGETEIDHKKIAFAHYPDKAKILAETGKYDFVFYGHTHKPWTEKINNCVMLNPGNVAGEFYPPTFAIWNTINDQFELKRIHDLI